MSRSKAAFAMTALALLAGLSVAVAEAAAQPPPPDSEVCPLVVGDQADVSVDENAIATPPCIKVKKGKTKVVWTGTDKVKLLLVAFKDPATKHPPEDPQCGGSQCVLEKLKVDKEGEFDYSIVVVRINGTTATVDPKLIIEPITTP